MGMSGGGDDGGAQAAEDARQRRIAETIDEINRVMDGANREASYADHRQNVYSLNMEDLGRQHETATRDMRFNLSRAGLSGGSADVDANSELQRIFDRGLLQAGMNADKAAESLRGSDERTRMNLISQAQTGMDTTTATQAALRQMNQNLDDASADTQMNALGDVFAQIANRYGRSAYIQGANSANPFMSGSGSSIAPAAPGRRYSGNMS